MAYVDLKDVILAVPAFTGMFLGLYNLWYQRRKDKVKLKVVPKSIKKRECYTNGVEQFLATSNEFNHEYIDKHFGVEVINLSSFSIIVDDVGFIVRGQKGRMSIVQPIVLDNKPWPRKLEPRESVTVYALLPDLLKSPNLPKVVSAFAETTCGWEVNGSSGALKGLIAFSKRQQSVR